MNRERIYAKLEKLRAVAERDCGSETQNAIRIIEKLLKQYNITNFNYKPFKAKSRNQSNSSQRTSQNEIIRFRVSFTSLMRALVLDLIKCRKLKYKIEGSKIYVYCTSVDYDDFCYYLKLLKKTWKERIDYINNDLSEFLLRSKWKK